MAQNRDVGKKLVISYFVCSLFPQTLHFCCQSFVFLHVVHKYLKTWNSCHWKFLKMSSKIWMWEFFLQIVIWNLSFPSSKDFKFLEKIPFLTSLYQALNESERKRRVGKLIKSNWKILPPLQRHPLPLFAACPFFHSSPFTESLAEANVCWQVITSQVEQLPHFIFYVLWCSSQVIGLK